MRSKYYDATGRFVNYTWDRWCQDNKFLYPILDDLKQYEFEFEMERIYPLKQREVFAVYNVLKIIQRLNPHGCSEVLPV